MCITCSIGYYCNGDKLGRKCFQEVFSPYSKGDYIVKILHGVNVFYYKKYLIPKVIKINC